MADFSPFSAAGFAPGQAPQAAATDNPFASAGFAAPPSPAAPPPAVSQQIGVDDYGAPIYAGASDNAAVAEGKTRVLEKGLEGATFGMAPYLIAGARWLGGVPFKQGLQDARGFTGQTSKDYPVASTIAEGAGSLIPTLATAGAASPGITAAAKALPRVGSYLANAVLGGGLGAASAAGQDIGSGNTDSLGNDVAAGAAIGGGLSAAAPLAGALLQSGPNMVRGGVSAVRNIATAPGKDAVAGQILREAGGDAGTFARSPIPDLSLRTAQASGDAGLAGLERMMAPPGVQNGRTAEQTGTLLKALVGADASIEPSVLTNQASARGTQAIQGVRAALRDHEQALWNAPDLQITIPRAGVVNGVNDDIAKMPPSFRQTIQNGPLSGAIADLADGEKQATIPDLNDARRRVLEMARSARASGDATTAAAANGLAGSILDRIGVAAASKGQPTLDAYQAARDFTRQRAQALGYPEFDAILRPNQAGNMRANDETAFGRFFDMNGGTDAGIQKLQTAATLARQAGNTQAASELEDATNQYLRAAVVRQARAGNGLDQAGLPQMNMATLASTTNKVMPAITGTPMTAPAAGDIQAAGNAAELLNRPSTLRGDTNSTTFEKLQKRDLVSAVLGQAGASGTGALLGGYLGAEHGPEGVPLYLRVPGGMLAGALMGQRLGPYVGKTLAHVPGASAVVTGPTNDIMDRVAAGLASPAEYQRLIGSHMFAGPGLTDPGVFSRAVPAAARAAIPMASARGASR